MGTRLFDSECLALAEHFLRDEPDLKASAAELAADIQGFIEDWISAAREPAIGDKAASPQEASR